MLASYSNSSESSSWRIPTSSRSHARRQGGEKKRERSGTGDISRGGRGRSRSSRVECTVQDRAADQQFAPSNGRSGSASLLSQHWLIVRSRVLHALVTHPHPPALCPRPPLGRRAGRAERSGRRPWTLPGERLRPRDDRDTPAPEKATSAQQNETPKTFVRRFILRASHCERRSITSRISTLTPSLHLKVVLCMSRSGLAHVLTVEGARLVDLPAMLQRLVAHRGGPVAARSPALGHIKQVQGMRSFGRPR